jgi:hypothetical protein
MSVAMPTTRPLQLTYLRPNASATPASTAVIPVVASTQWIPQAMRLPPSPDPTFVTQLIANAEQLAERRRWPRDRAADANSAYHQHRVFGAGLKTRQTI